MTGARPSDSSSTSSSSGAHISAEAMRQHLPLAAGQQARRCDRAARASRGKNSKTRSPADALGDAAAGRRRAPRFSATVRFGNTFSRSGTSTMPRARDPVRRRFSMRCALERDRAFGDARVVECRESPEIARSVVVLPAPLVPSSATIWPCRHVERDALHRGDHAVIDDLELFDVQQRLAHLAPAAAGA